VDYLANQANHFKHYEVVAQFMADQIPELINDSNLF